MQKFISTVIALFLVLTSAQAALPLFETETTENGTAIACDNQALVKRTPHTAVKLYEV